MPKTMNSGQAIRIYKEMWVRLRRSRSSAYRQSEQRWMDNLIAILSLRQRCTENYGWGNSRRDRAFDAQLRRSVVAQLRLALSLRHFTSRFIRQLLEKFRQLILGETHDDALLATGLTPETFDDRILDRVVKAQLKELKLPDEAFVQSARLMAGRAAA